MKKINKSSKINFRQIKFDKLIFHTHMHVYLLTHKLYPRFYVQQVLCTSSSFKIVSVIRGYHEYKAIWGDSINSKDFSLSV